MRQTLIKAFLFISLGNAISYEMKDVSKADAHPATSTPMAYLNYILAARKEHRYNDVNKAKEQGI